MDLSKYVQTIVTEQDFVEFVQKFAAEVRENPAKYENRNLPDFLEAMASWTADRDGYYHNIDQPVPQIENWRAIADLLVASSLYE